MPREPYLSVDALLYHHMLTDGTNQEICRRILKENAEVLKFAWGSSHNHQAWPGGYLHHVAEVLNIAVALYPAMDILRPLPFRKSDAVLVLFLHDIEKPWRFRYGPNGERESIPEMQTKEQRKAFREKFLKENGLHLNDIQMNALTYVEGEYKDYSSKKRIMNELAAFCHMCDVASARIWHDHPKEKDHWTGAKRSRSG